MIKLLLHDTPQGAGGPAAMNMGPAAKNMVPAAKNMGAAAKNMGAATMNMGAVASHSPPTPPDAVALATQKLAEANEAAAAAL